MSNRLGLWMGAYVVGLAVAEWSDRGAWGSPLWAGLGIVGLAIGLGQISPRYWHWGLRRRDWLIAGGIAWVATGWWLLRYPTPSAQDISQWTAASTPTQLVTGWIASPPGLTRSDRVRFWLATEAIAAPDLPDKTTPTQGQLYVTLPFVETDPALYPGQHVRLTGRLYAPRSPVNPGGFDFRAYLARQGGFAGFSGDDVEVLIPRPSWGWRRVQYELAQVRSRMVQGAVAGLGSPAGELVSGMVLGRQAVNLPYDIQDGFIRAGLAHTLAASGFHVSLLLSVVLGLTQRGRPSFRLGIGIISLLGYVGLTGVQPSVMRAALMGVGALIGSTLERRVKPIGALVAAGILLLLVNPLWISSLGLWLSFLATLGLLVSVPTIMKGLDWLPTPIATLFAVPLAASLWVLPLQLCAFGVVSPYSVLLNAITTPLIVIITLGGMLSALASLGSLSLGGAIAWTLTYPVQALMSLVQWSNQLPGSSFGIGNILLVTMLGLYGLWLLGWQHPWWRSRRWVVGLLAIAIVFLPGGYAQATRVQTMVLSTPDHPTLLWRDRGQVILFSDGNVQAMQYALMPYLRQQGLYQIDHAITPWLSREERWLQGWQLLTTDMEIATLHTGETPPPSAIVALPDVPIHPLPIQAPLTMGEMTVIVQRTEPLVIQVQQADQTWVLLPTLSTVNPSRFQQAQQTLMSSRILATPMDVFYWSGAPLDPVIVANINTTVAIAAATTLDATTAQAWRDRGIPVYLTGRDGAIAWTPRQGVKALGEANPDGPNF